MSSSVLGVRVHADSVVDTDVRLDDSFKAVPVPNKLGIPLVYKLMSGTGGDDSHIRSNMIVRFMAEPDDGFAPAAWQYGGRMGPAPPVVLARRDKLPFSQQDYLSLDAYMSDWREEFGEADEGTLEISERWLAPEAYKMHVRNNCDPAPAGEPQRWWAPTAMLSLQFPAGSTVVPSGLSVAELNGLEGIVAQYSRDRVGVQFPDRERTLQNPNGVTALRPEKLTLLKEAPAEPAAKRQDVGIIKEAKVQRDTQVARKEALLIATRFIECLHQDTFPEIPELHLFGLGGEYRARAAEALAVWQAAAKNGAVTAEELADALQAGSQQKLFEGLCYEIRDSRLPNQPYAVSLIDAKFAALEFDTL